MKQIRLKDGSVRKLNPTEIMGIINVTPDSFFEGSRVSSVEAALERAAAMIADGAAFLDVGGESTRPGARPVTPREEAERICPVIRQIKERFPEVLLSADTYHASTAQAAVAAGADIINDISGLTFDPEMIPVCAAAGVPVIIMHIKGTPEHMQDNPQYGNVVEEVYAFLEERVQEAVRGGIARDRILIDLGIGFGKTCDHNVALLQNISRFEALGLPHLMAVSRKTFIGMLLGKDGNVLPPGERLYGTIAASLYAREKGIEIVRVHDVKENAQALQIFDRLLSGEDAFLPEAVGDVCREGECGNVGRAAADAADGETCRAAVPAVVALGSNMGDRENYLDRALEQLEKRAGRIVRRSSVIETKAYGYTDQADFLNMAVLLETKLKPHELLDVLHEIEAELDRVRVIHWGPRTIDLDIIFYGNIVMDDPDLIIPHADYANRDFVLRPLLEIAPEYVDPVTGKTVRETADL
ncbi:MAG: dihydropteroate synthase [Eubacterium sp.]|nr:dihydropteroate synthase [Eubacterium sp.]